MYKDKVISVVVPAHNEQKLIQKVLQDRPHWIDQIFVIDDYSQDATSDKVRERMETDSRIVLIRHEENRGVGAAICTGYKASLDNDVDIAVVMAGDAQMDPADLENLIRPVALEGGGIMPRAIACFRVKPGISFPVTGISATAFCLC